MPITRNFTLYLNAGISVAPTVHVNQYDRGEQWVFTLLDDKGQKYTPSSGALIGVKADGNAIAGVTGTVGSNGDVYITETQQMTAAAGKAIFELTIDGMTHGTANFIVQVEKKPTDDAVLSESDLSIIQQGIDSVTPAAINETVSEYLAEHMTNPPIDPTLTVSNAAADAKVTGDKVTELKSAFNSVLYGIDITPAYTTGSNNKYHILFVKGQNYTVANNTTKGSNVVLVRSDGTTKIITGNLASGASISFVPDEENYIALQMFIDAEATGTINISAEISAYGRIDDLEENAEKNNADIERLYNSFNDFLYGATYNFTGTVSAINKFNMPLFEGLKYTATNNTGAAIGVDLYKADGTSKRVTSSLANGASIEFTVDSADYTQIGGWFNAGSTGNLVVTCDFSVINKLDDLDDLYNATEENAENIDEVTKTVNVDITSSATKHENMFYNINNQFYTGGGQWDYYTLAVTPGESYTIDTVAGGTVRGWAFRDSSENQLSIASYKGDVVQKKYEDVIAPSGAVEMIINLKHVSGYLTITKNGIVVLNEDKIIYNGKKLPYYLDRVAGVSRNKLYGKVLCCCGDSITYGADMDSPGIVTPSIESYQYSAYTKKWTRWTAEEPAAYGYQIAARNDMIFYNGGVSGATVQGSGDDLSVPGFSVADGEYTLLPENIDYLTLFYGWNDTAYGTLGTINDNTNASYYGAYNVVLPYLINKYPYTKIGIIVPFGCDAGHREAVRLLANKWGIACFDNYQGGTPLYYGKEDSVGVESSIVTANRTKFQANGAHPNFAGHKQLADMIEQWMRGI